MENLGQNYKEIEEDIKNYLYKTYTIFPINGICLPTTDIDVTTYALGFRYSDIDKEKGREILIKSCKETPTTLLTKIPYKLYIRSVEYIVYEDREECFLRLKVE